MRHDPGCPSRAGQGHLALWAYASPTREVEGQTDLAQRRTRGDPLGGSGKPPRIRVRRHAAPS